MSVRLEHANLTVRDLAGMIQFLQTAFPEFRVRGEGTSQAGDHWGHVGTDETYLALTQARASDNGHFKPYGGAPGVNHLAYVVDDVEALRNRLSAAGYKDSTPPNKHPHRARQYFYDSEGNDWDSIFPRIQPSATTTSCRTASARTGCMTRLVAKNTVFVP